MFAGHVGVGLALGPAERRLNVGVFVAAALLLDIVLWSLILLGWESVVIPAEFASIHQPNFIFPYSHGLVAAGLWSLATAALLWLWLGNDARAAWPAAALIAAAVFSHWILDALVHRPEMPVAGTDSAKVGLGLWDHMPIALLIEAAIVALGLALFLRRSNLSRPRSIALVVLTVAILAFTGIGMTFAPPPPSATAMAASSLITLVVIAALYGWIGRPPRGDAGAAR